MTSKLKFSSRKKALLVDAGEYLDKQNRDFIRDAVGIKQKKVEAKRHAILSGPPGVGKSYGARDECIRAGLNFIELAPGSSMSASVGQISYAVYNLKPKQELVVLLDDADNVVFGEYDDMKTWTIAWSRADYNIGYIPKLIHNVNMTTQIKNLENAGKTAMVEAIKYFQEPGEVGVSIPVDRVRFVVLCNLDLEDLKSIRSAKMRSAVGPLVDRVKYKRLSVSEDEQWGWLAYTLGRTQPFDGHDLSNAQKIRLLDWMYDNWSKLRSTSYRTVEDLAAAMINDPDDYEETWNNNLRGK